MTRHLAILFLLILKVNFSIGQDSSLRMLVNETEKLNLDMYQLVDFAKENIQSERDLAQFFYYWIGSYIKYDNELLTELEDGLLTNEAFWESQDYSQVFSTRKGVCAGYSRLYEWFMNELEMEVVVISGHIRDERNHYIELSSDDDFRHGWNAVKLKGEWILLDSTWGTSESKELSDFYFDISPDLAIITHFPEDNKWQLLDNPLTLEEFNNSKFIKPVWFQIGFTDIPTLKEDKDSYYLVYKSNPDNNWHVSLLYSTDNTNYQFIHPTMSFENDGTTFVRFSKENIPKKAFYKMDLNYRDAETGMSTFIFNVYYFKT